MDIDFFTTHLIEGYMSNIYLIEYPDGILLLDSGSVPDFEMIAEYCDRTLKRPVSDIKLVIVSHMHPDHAGGALSFRKYYKIPIAASDKADLWYKGLTGSIQHFIDMHMAQKMRKLNKKKLLKIKYKKKLRPDFKLKDGDSLPFFDDWMVINTPGHTTHDLVLFNKAKRLLYGADCLININNKIKLPIPITFKNEMKTSFDRLKKLNIEKILLAHGNEITQDISGVFNIVSELLEAPPLAIIKRKEFLFSFTPEVWKSKLKIFPTG